VSPARDGRVHAGLGPDLDRTAVRAVRRRRVPMDLCTAFLYTEDEIVVKIQRDLFDGSWI
jgi:hypothetical protein